MSALILVAIYVVMGVVCVAIFRRREGVDAGDLFLLAVGWPLYLPFMLGEAPEAEGELGRSLKQGRAVALGAWLPDEATAQRVEHRLAAAARRVAEIERLLEEPDFDLEAAQARAARLRREGRAAASSAERTARNIERLIALRLRYLSEIEDIEELARQLRTQAEIFRLAGQEEPNALLDELMSRVDSLDAVLDDELIFADLPQA